MVEKRIVDLVLGDCIFEEKTGGSKAHLNAYEPHIMRPYEAISFTLLDIKEYPLVFETVIGISKNDIFQR